MKAYFVNTLCTKSKVSFLDNGDRNLSDRCLKNNHYLDIKLELNEKIFVLNSDKLTL